MSSRLSVWSGEREVPATSLQKPFIMVQQVNSSVVAILTSYVYICTHRYNSRFVYCGRHGPGYLLKLMVLGANPRHVYKYTLYLRYTCIEFSILFTIKANVNIATIPEFTYSCSLAWHSDLRGGFRIGRPNVRIMIIWVGGVSSTVWLGRQQL